MERGCGEDFDRAEKVCGLEDGKGSELVVKKIVGHSLVSLSLYKGFCTLYGISDVRF